MRDGAARQGVWAVLLAAWTAAAPAAAAEAEIPPPLQAKLHKIFGEPFDGVGHPAAAFHPNGKELAYSLGDADVHFWNLAEGKETAPPLKKAIEGGVGRLAYSADGGLLAAAGRWKGLKLWKGPEKEEVGALDASTPFLAFRPDGALLAVVGGDGDRSVNLWDAATLKKKTTLPPEVDGATYAAFSPDGAKIAVFTPQGAIRLFNLENGKQVQRIEPHPGEGRWFAFTPDGSSIVSSGEEGALVVTSLESGRPTGVMKQRGTVLAGALSPDGERAAVGLFGGRVVVWDLASRRRIAPLSVGRGSVSCLQFSPDGKRLVAGGSDDRVFLWDLQ